MHHLDYPAPNKVELPMTASEPANSLIYYLLIPHPSEQCILMLKHRGTLVLPAFIPEESGINIVRHINRIAYELTGLHLTTLQYFRGVSHESQNENYRYYAMDNIDRISTLPSHAGWVAIGHLAEKIAHSPEHIPVIQAWSNWLHTEGTTRLRVPWTRRGWFVRAEDWLLDLADRLDMQMRGNVIQERVWSRACTMRLNTHDSALYFKAAHPVFSYEAVITRVLYLRYRNYLPEVLAVNVDEGWLLLREFDAVPLSASHPVEIWEGVMRVFAAIQMDLINATHSLIALGVPDRNVDFLISQIEGMLARMPEGLENEEKMRLLTLSPRLRQYGYELLNFDIPLTLTHGDLRAGNIVIQSDRTPLFYDWSDCVITHPFFDIAHFLTESAALLPPEPGIRQRLVRAYLQPWTDHLPLYELLQAFSLAETLYHLHRITLYQDYVVPVLSDGDLLAAEDNLTAMMRGLLSEMSAYQR